MDKFDADDICTHCGLDWVDHGDENECPEPICDCRGPQSCNDCDPDGSLRRGSRYTQADWSYRRAESGHSE